MLEVQDVTKGLNLTLEANKQFPSDAEVLNALGWAYLENQQLELARTTLEQGLDVDPTYPPLYFTLGRVEEAEGLVGKARELYLQALDLDTGGGITRRSEEALKRLGKE